MFKDIMFRLHSFITSYNHVHSQLVLCERNLCNMYVCNWVREGAKGEEKGEPETSQVNRCGKFNAEHKLLKRVVKSWAISDQTSAKSE